MCWRSTLNLGLVLPIGCFKNFWLWPIRTSPREKKATMPLMTKLCWWLSDVGWRLLAEPLCYGGFFLYVFNIWNVQTGHQNLKSVTDISNLSPAQTVSNFRRQHRCRSRVKVGQGFAWKYRRFRATDGSKIKINGYRKFLRSES